MLSLQNSSRVSMAGAGDTLNFNGPREEAYQCAAGFERRPTVVVGDNSDCPETFPHQEILLFKTLALAFRLYWKVHTGHDHLVFHPKTLKCLS